MTIAPFVPDAVLPAQVFARRRGHCGERALLVALLEDACHIIALTVEQTPRWPRGGHWWRLRREALEWMASDDRRDICSFLTLCDAVGLEPTGIRKRYGIP